ncbi:TVP38/TMEM64 family protein [Nocardioides coralli]|uniref:TVP38/TMEM64 family protein n=1 Tax=Nocardioides coralli TaxID=2872154 RepID=UPI001CA3B701|nr:TVP38/TMEM64 family protein [Nocardioides coralli]QZY30129.1 TVP38/TMEM64 family protein [Nocardioides coralli]
MTPEQTARSRRSSWLRLAAFSLVVAAAVAVALVVDLPSADQLRDRVESAGWAAPVLFVAVYVASTIAPVPKHVISAAAGLAFGLALGVALVWLGAMIGAVASFWLGRLLGRSAVERISGGRVAQLDALLSRHGLVTVLLLRLVAVVPFTAINYAAGLTGLRHRDYVIGTGIGILPGTAAFVALGSYGTSPTSWPFLTAAAVLVLLTVLGTVAARRNWVRGRGEAR